MISHDEMETKVRQHRKFLKQSEFLKRQAAKERQQNAETLKNAQGALIEKVKEKMAETAAETPDEDNNMEESSSAVHGSRGAGSILGHFQPLLGRSNFYVFLFLGV